MSLVNWTTICQPKNKGGVGLEKLPHIGWNIIASPRSLWIMVLRTKYGLDSDGIPTKLNSRNGSNLWRAICNVWPHVTKGIRWATGNGQHVNFWNDNWVPEVSNLRSQVRQQIPVMLAKTSVANMAGLDGSRRWDVFGHLLSNKHIL